MCLWAIYVFPRPICPFCCRKYVDRSWEYINRSQTHECGNWGWGRAIPRKGIHKWDFHCSAGKAWSTSLGCTPFTVPEPSWRNVHHCFDRWKFPWGRQAWIRPRWGLYYFPCQIIINYVGLQSACSLFGAGKRIRVCSLCMTSYIPCLHLKGTKHGMFWGYFVQSTGTTVLVSNIAGYKLAKLVNPS